jgi:hypothetical protein
LLFGTVPVDNWNSNPGFSHNMPANVQNPAFHNIDMKVPAG